MMDAGETTVVAMGDRARVEELALVLAAAGIPHRVTATGAGWRVMVSEDAAASARGALAAYEGETRAVIAPPVPEPEYGRTYAGVVLAACLVAFYAHTGPAAGAGAWGEAGGASTTHVLAGELWRTVTALTLHANPAHLAANAVACAVFVTAVARALGPGAAAALVLLSGAAGNVLNALLRGPGHRSVGASTAVFGAIGILAGLEFARRRRPRPRRRPWVPLAAGLGLLAMLGSGERTDLGAHACGLLAGAVVGVAAARLRLRPPSSGVQAALAAGAAGALVGCWLLAFP